MCVIETPKEANEKGNEVLILTAIARCWGFLTYTCTARCIYFRFLTVSLVKAQAEWWKLKSNLLTLWGKESLDISSTEASLISAGDWFFPFEWRFQIVRFKWGNKTCTWRRATLIESSEREAVTPRLLLRVRKKCSKYLFLLGKIVNKNNVHWNPLYCKM